MIIYKFKLLLLGPASVGKTSLLNRFVKNEFKKDYLSTIGVQFLSKELRINPDDSSDDGEAHLSIWDVGGQPSFLDLRTTFYRGSQGALLVFDLTRENTFKEINVWHSEMVTVLAKEIPLILIGNKLDLKGRKVKRKDALAFAKAKNCIYIETSALTGENVEKSFLKLTQMIVTEEHGIEFPEKTDKKKGKKKTKKASKNEGGGAYFIKSKVRNYIKAQGCNTSSSLLNGDVLNNKIIGILDKAISRAKDNGRKTIQPKDI